MKRSKSIKLVVLATGGLSLAACDGGITSTNGRVYKTETECRSDGFISGADCPKVFETGAEIHQVAGPRYNTYNLCAQSHGMDNCVTSSSGSTYFYTSKVAGYFVARLEDGSTNTESIRPIYPSQDGKRHTMPGGFVIAYFGNNSWRANSSAFTSTPQRAEVVKRTNVVSKGGFGSRASASSRSSAS